METDKSTSPTCASWSVRYIAIYLALLLGFGTSIVLRYHAQGGFSSLILFGDYFAARRLPQLRQVPLFTYTDSFGYDGQFYAQLAVAGNPFDPGLERALDAPKYRSQRILLPALVHLAGLGRPAWIVQIYALSNLICFMVLAGLLACWWFPPTSLSHLIRWTGTLFGAGMVVSVTRSLTDVPALLVVAVGARLVESNRRFFGAAILGAAGLVRETSVLAAAGLASLGKPVRRWPSAALAIVICVAPTVLWAMVLSHHYGRGPAVPAFAAPFVGFGEKLAAIYRHWRSAGLDGYVRSESAVVIALATQAGFILLRIRPAHLWWRIGASFALLTLCIAGPVWEGTPSAAPRAVLPLTLAFNLLVPCSRRYWPVLLAGNLSVSSVFALL